MAEKASLLPSWVPKLDSNSTILRHALKQDFAAMCTLKDNANWLQMQN